MNICIFNAVSKKFIFACTVINLNSACDLKKNREKGGGRSIFVFYIHLHYIKIYSPRFPESSFM